MMAEDNELSDKHCVVLSCFQIVLVSCMMIDSEYKNAIFHILEREECIL